LSNEVELDELVSCGTLGLMDALESFDSTRGLAFSTYAVPRIRGAILDELRRQDRVPRTVRRRSRELGHARERLTSDLGRQPSQRELAGQLGVDMDTMWRWQADNEWHRHTSLDEPSFDHGDSHSESREAITAVAYNGADEDVNHELEVECMKRAIGCLKEQEQVVLSLYYFEELKLHQIAVVLGVTESRVSQVRTKALARLRTALMGLRQAVA
jgi:RNA polymerase sigma factor for flagellar operon FliA